MNDELKKLLIEDYKRRFPEKKFIPRESAVPVSGKVFDENEILSMTEAVLEGWWTEGKYSVLLESKLAEYIGVNTI